MAFIDPDKVIDGAKSLPFGLGAYAFTESSKIANRFADRLEVVRQLSINHFVASVAENAVRRCQRGREGGVEGIAANLIAKGVPATSVLMDLVRFVWSTTARFSSRSRRRRI